MRKGILGLTAAGAVLALGVAGCSSSKSSGSSSGGSSPSATGGTGGASSAPAKLSNNKVGILLPDTASSPRWVNSDPQALTAACKQYGLQCKIDNADGSASTMETEATSLLNDGVGVLLVVNLDSASGTAIENQAANKGVVAIDYDRLTLGGSAKYYVSYDGVAVGKAQGTALTQCPEVKGKSSVNYVDINGAPTDNNATLFKQGYDSVLSTQPGWHKLADQSGQWSAPTAQTVFQSMLNQNHDINAVMVANDTMAQSVINVLKSVGLDKKVAVSGQDTTPGGLQNVLTGDQCFTIYKPVAGEANPAIKLAYEILAGQKPSAPQTSNDPTGHRSVPSFLANPVVITKANIDQPFKDGYVKYSDVCTGAYTALCTAAGITQ
jgi:D-xylose transport system substrate-binding protein